MDTIERGLHHIYCMDTIERGLHHIYCMDTIERGLHHILYCMDTIERGLHHIYCMDTIERSASYILYGHTLGEALTTGISGRSTAHRKPEVWNKIVHKCKLRIVDTSIKCSLLSGFPLSEV